MQIPASNYPTYQAPNRDYAYYGPVKRQRTSVDFGTRNVYEPEGRMRQIEAYPQTAAMYGQPGSYPTPMMPGYPTGHTGVPDYAVRQTQAPWTHPDQDPCRFRNDGYSGVQDGL
jgi:hypothetical protein